MANGRDSVMRVFQTVHEMGTPCVAVHSILGRDVLHVKLANEALHSPPPYILTLHHTYHQ